MGLRSLVPALALVLAAGCARSSAAGTSAPNAPALPPAVRAPGWSVDQIRDLRARLQSAFSPPGLNTSGIAIVDADARPLFTRLERRPLAPASTFKVLVAVTALQTLGSDYRFTTQFESFDEPHDGTLDGDVFLVGSGDPTLRSDDLRAGVGALVRRGIRHITGSIVADASTFGGREVNPAWDPDDLQYGYAAGTSALSLDEGTVEFHLVPSTAGAPARIEVRPPNDGVHVLGGVITGYATSLSIDRAAASNTFTFAGRVAVGAEQSFWRPVLDMPRYTAGAVRTMLAERGVRVDGEIETGPAPIVSTVLWQHRSPPVRSILHDMLFQSDNHYAEQLLRAVGARDGGTGTEASGGAVERTVFRTLEAPTEGLRIVDGSGLAASDRVAPLSLATLLAHEALLPTGGTFIADLPRVGIEGTVRNRDVTTALGRVRAKSGHIENVNALAGYVQTRSHGRVAFAVLVNDRRADDGPVDAGIDRALDVLARE
jgi:serine-type D-Ala-D-Ala carboxypeptidase/endopeptidase (penicillin-binding protein 4)